MTNRSNPREIKALGYIEAQTTDMERWRKLAIDVLGFAEGAGVEEAALDLRADVRAARGIERPGEPVQLTAVGWEGRDREALARVRAAVEAAGTTVEDLTAEQADARRVESAITFLDPA